MVADFFGLYSQRRQLPGNQEGRGAHPHLYQGVAFTDDQKAEKMPVAQNVQPVRYFTGKIFYHDSKTSSGLTPPP